MPFCEGENVIPLPAVEVPTRISPRELKVRITEGCTHQFTGSSRTLSNTPLQIEVSLLQTASHEAKNVSEQHLDTFYTTFDEIKDQRFDGMIITGAPVELLDFEDVDYWDELARIMDWSATNVHSTFHICWGAQAGIYHHYGIPKYELENKLFGVVAAIVAVSAQLLFAQSTFNAFFPGSDVLPGSWVYLVI